MSAAVRWYEISALFHKYLNIVDFRRLFWERRQGMYLHLGQNEIVPEDRVIGIFDLDKCSYEKRTRDYLAAAEREA